jgi:hypothetical protein
MMQIIEGVIAILCVLSIIFFLVYVVGLLRLPTGSRPDTPVFNRYGEQIGEMENPGFEETEDERE